MAITPDPLCSAGLGRYINATLEVSVIPMAQKSELRGKPLSEREFEVLQLIADGRTAEQIGRRLGITADTVRTHVHRLLRKLDARDRAHAVALSFQMSLLPVRDSTPHQQSSSSGPSNRDTATTRRRAS